MLKVDPSLNHIPARREHVVALFESINQPLVNIPGHGTAPTYAYILGTRNDQGQLSIFVYLFQQQTGAVVVYVCDPRALGREQYRAEEADAVRFVESMGFLIDNVHFPTLPPHEQDAVVQRTPLFRPPPAPSAASLGGTSPALDGDALFGGLGEAESEVFRRAGVSSSPPRPAGVPTDIVPGRPESPAPTSSPMAAPRSEKPQPGMDPEAKARLGRLFGLFLALFSLGVGNLACVTARETNEDTRTIESHVDLGNQQLARGMWPDAVRTFMTVLEENEQHRDALRGLGLAYLNLGRLPEAEGFYRRAIEADPKWSIPKNELAVVLMETGQCGEAQTLLEKVLEDIFYPTPEFAEHNLARAQACQGDYAGAVKRLETLLVKRPQFCLGYLTLAQFALDAKSFETTIQACDDFVANCAENERIKAQILPEHLSQCYLSKGRAFAELDDVESARASFERCASKGPAGRECERSLRLLPP